MIKSSSCSRTSSAGRQVRVAGTGIDVAWGTQERKTRSISRWTLAGLRRTERRTMIMVIPPGIQVNFADLLRRRS
jgi:hypothetical protein